MKNSRKVGIFVCFSSLSLAVSKEAIKTELQTGVSQFRGGGQYIMALREQICQGLVAHGQTILSQPCSRSQ